MFKETSFSGQILFSGGALDPYFTWLKNTTCTYTLVNHLFFKFLMLFPHWKMMTDELIAQEKRAFGVNLLEALVFFDA